MILCSDYNSNDCPIECLHASDTELFIQKIGYEDFRTLFTKSKLYGTNICPLTSKPNKQNYILKGENNNGKS